MQDDNRAARFDRCIVPHLDAAYNLARWMLAGSHDADDVVQDAFLRAFRAFDGFRGGDGKPWLLAIVRNVCYSFLRARKVEGEALEFDEKMHSPVDVATANPEWRLLEEVDKDALQRAINDLPPLFREAIVLRDLEELSYKEIAEISGVPIGTVKSRLSRARVRLQNQLAGPGRKEQGNEV